MTTVYRIQAEDGRGPWRPGFSHYWSEDWERPKAIHEIFGTDWLRECKPNMMYGCGCLSLKELAKWFTQGEMNNLEKMGYYPVAIVADVILRKCDGVQVIFGCKKHFGKIAVPIQWKMLTGENHALQKWS